MTPPPPETGPNRPASSNTERAYRQQWSRFTAWCGESGHSPLPASGHVLSQYIAHLAALELGPATLEQAISAITRAHRDAEAEPPYLSPARAVIAGRRRTLQQAGWRTQRAIALTPAELAAMLEHCDPHTPPGARDAAIVLLGTHLMALPSELISLNIKDIDLDPHNLTVRVNRAGNAASSRIVRVARNPVPLLCPVSATENWMEHLARAGHTTGPLLRSVGRGGALSTSGRLTTSVIGHVVGRLAHVAGLPHADRITAASLRVTGAQLAFAAGAGPDQVAATGGWAQDSTAVFDHWAEAASHADRYWTRSDL